MVVLEHGRITERGTPAQLQTAGGIYQKIYEIQLGVRGADAGLEARADGKEAAYAR